MGTAEIIAALDEEIAQLQRVRNLLDGHETGNGRVKAQAGPKIKARVGGETGNGTAARKHVLSPEARKRIADAQRKRWAKAKKAAK